MGSGPNWYQNGSKICYIPLVSKFSAKETLSMLTGLKVSYLGCKCVFTDQNIMQRGDLTELNFEIL